jgi:hypothetical protein
MHRWRRGGGGQGKEPRIVRKIAAEEGSQRRRRLAAWGLDI